MASLAGEKVTVDKSYFDALLRRADFHTSAQLLGRPDPANVTISRAEYDSLLRDAREFDLLKTALFQGGLTPDTLQLLISGAGDVQPPQDPAADWADDYDDMPPVYGKPTSYSNGNSYQKPSAGPPGISYPSYHAPASTNLRAPIESRQVSNGIVPSSVPEKSGFSEDDSIMDGGSTEVDAAARLDTRALRTLYFVGFNARTTYQDLLSVIKGGKILSVNLRSEKSATVTFLDAAADYLSWTKRNDIYLNGKRVEVRWADRQFHLNNHISNKIANGATRNILIRNAIEKGLTEHQIRDDMEHIHGLVIINVVFRAGHAYVSTNSVHNALFARTCMMSRQSYRGCKIEFFPDECDVPLPMRHAAPKSTAREPPKKRPALTNRFDMLNMDGNESDSNEENRDPFESHAGDSEDDDDTINVRARHGVRLDFLDADD